MQYRKRGDGSLVSKGQLITENANTSLPKTWKEATLDFLDVDPVLSSLAPVASKYEVVERNGVEQNAEGNWVEAWEVKPMFVEYATPIDGNDVGLGTTVVTVDEQIAAYDAQQLQQKREGMVVSMRQCRLALLADGTLANVDVAIASLPEPDKSAAQVEWEYAATVQRTSPFVASLGMAIGYDDAKMDALFEAAADL